MPLFGGCLHNCAIRGIKIERLGTQDGSVIKLENRVAPQTITIIPANEGVIFKCFVSDA